MVDTSNARYLPPTTKNMNYIYSTFFSALLLPMMLSSMAADTKTNKNPLLNPKIYQEESLDTLKSLLAEKKYTVNEEDEFYCRLPLGMAIEAGDHTAVILLLKNGANPNQIFNKSSPRTILSWCIFHGTPEATTLLIQNGANPNLATELHHPLFDAVEDAIFFKSKGTRSLAILLRAGANPLTATHAGKTIFEHMKYEGDVIVDDFRSLEPNHELYDYCKEKAIKYQKAGRALVQYKILWNHLHRNWGLPAEIVQHVLTFVDFGLDDYHAVKTQ